MSALFFAAIAFAFKEGDYSLGFTDTSIIIGMFIVGLVYLMQSGDLFLGKMKGNHYIAGASFLALYFFCVIISFTPFWIRRLGGESIAEGIVGFLIALVVVTGLVIIPISFRIGKITQIAFGTGVLIGHWILIIYAGVTSDMSKGTYKMMYIFTHKAALFAYQHYYISILTGIIYYFFYYWMQGRLPKKLVNQEDKNPLEGGIDRFS